MRLFDDTTGETRRAYIRLLAQASPEKKVEMVSTLYLLAVQAARSGLRTRFPGISEEEFSASLARLMLGKEQAASFLAQRNGEESAGTI